MNVVGFVGDGDDDDERIGVVGGWWRVVSSNPCTGKG